MFQNLNKMVVQAEQERMRALLVEAITCLCKNAMKFNRSLCVQGLLGITLDEKDVILVDIKVQHFKFQIIQQIIMHT